MPKYKVILTRRTNFCSEMLRFSKLAEIQSRDSFDFNIFSKSNGQAAIEYMIVFGLALALASPFVLKAQSSIIDLRSDSNAVAVQNSLNNIEMAAETVNAAGEPAARSFGVRMPQTISSTWVLDKAIVVQVAEANTKSNFSRTFDFNVSGDIPDQPGRYVMRTQANNSKVVLEVTS